MEKISGRGLVNSGDLPVSERDEVRIAFIKALRFLIILQHANIEFRSCGLKHFDPDRRNVIWDPKQKRDESDRSV